MGSCRTELIAENAAGSIDSVHRVGKVENRVTQRFADQIGIVVEGSLLDGCFDVGENAGVDGVPSIEIQNAKGVARIGHDESLADLKMRGEASAMNFVRTRLMVQGERYSQ